MPRSLKVPPAEPKLIGSSRPVEELPWAKRPVTVKPISRRGNQPKRAAKEPVGRFQNVAARRLQRGL